MTICTTGVIFIKASWIFLCVSEKAKVEQTKKKNKYRKHKRGKDARKQESRQELQKQDKGLRNKTDFSNVVWKLLRGQVRKNESYAQFSKESGGDVDRQGFPGFILGLLFFLSNIYIYVHTHRVRACLKKWYCRWKNLLPATNRIPWPLK